MLQHIRQRCQHYVLPLPICAFYKPDRSLRRPMLQKNALCLGDLAGAFSALRIVQGDDEIRVRSSLNPFCNGIPGG
ncbi:hypothetical protein D3C81_1892290 [compost metagenome]